MCVYSAAKTLGLKFVPVGKEQYEIVTRKENLSDPRVAALFETVSSPEFIGTLERLGGYDTSGDGTQAPTALITASSGLSQTIIPGISHVWYPNTGFPIFRAAEISERVP